CSGGKIPAARCPHHWSFPVPLLKALKTPQLIVLPYAHCRFASSDGRFGRPLKKSDSCFDRLSTNGKSPTMTSLPPFALSWSKGERRVFQHSVRIAEELRILYSTFRLDE